MANENAASEKKPASDKKATSDKKNSSDKKTTSGKKTAAFRFRSMRLPNSFCEAWEGEALIRRPSSPRCR